MVTRGLAVIGSGPEAWGWVAVEATLAQWSGDDRPEIVRFTMEAVLENHSVLEGCDVAWVLIDDTGRSSLLEVLGVLQELQIPGMLSRPNESEPVGFLYKHGVVIGPPDASTYTLCTVLRTLWSQGSVIRGLQSEIRLLRAQQGGLCGQINKIDEELRTAAQLQREFMPASLPSHGAVSFHVLFRPAGYVSGDVYDVARLDDRHMAFFLADAVGHGVPAALLTMHIKHSLRSKQIDANGDGHVITPPNEVLSQLNRDMMRQPGGKMRFASACYGVIDCQTLQMKFARAGHPFPVLLRSDGTTEYLDPDGTLLGIFPNKEFESIDVQLRAGDRVLLYSDGIELAFGYERELGGDEDSLPSYMDDLKDLGNGPLDEAVWRMEAKLDTQIGSLNLRDDLTVMCIGIREDALVGVGSGGEMAGHAAGER